MTMVSKIFPTRNRKSQMILKLTYGCSFDTMKVDLSNHIPSIKSKIKYPPICDQTNEFLGGVVQAISLPSAEID